MTPVSVVKLSKNDNSYRTPVQDLDYICEEPEVGQHLMLYSSTHESGGVSTSIVTEVLKEDTGWLVTTKFSKYRITKLQESSC